MGKIAIVLMATLLVACGGGKGKGACELGSCVDAAIPDSDGGTGDGGTGDDGAQPDAAPCTSRLEVQTSGAFNADLPVVQVSGTVTVNGQPMPASPHDRGHLDFQDQDSHARSMPGFGATGPGTYSGSIFAGTYDVTYRHAPACQHNDPIPCQDHLAKKSVALNASGSLNLDLVVVQVSGAVTLNGQPLPASPHDRGQLDFQDQDSHARSMPGFGASGPGTYSGSIFAGTYDVFYRHAPACQHDDPIPCQDHLAKKSVALNASGNLDLDLVVVQLSGQITVNTKPMPDSPHDRGHLELRDQDGLARSMPGFGPSGPGTYSGDLFAGSYDVVYRHAPACQHADPIPCQDHLLRGCPAQSD
jgi:uncharacterized Zn-binding protein involved in type VI secretion